MSITESLKDIACAWKLLPQYIDQPVDPLFLGLGLPVPVPVPMPVPMPGSRRRSVKLRPDGHCAIYVRLDLRERVGIARDRILAERFADIATLHFWPLRVFLRKHPPEPPRDYLYRSLDFVRADAAAEPKVMQYLKELEEIFRRLGRCQ